MATILIGNGPSVKENTLGELIDSFGTVCRMNGAHITPKHSPYVGSHTDIWFFNTRFRGDNLRALMYLRDSKIDVPYFVIYPSDKSTEYPKTKMFIQQNFPESTATYVRDKHDKAAKTFTCTRPTMGIVALTWLIMEGYAPVYLYGFDMLDLLEGDTWDKGHYDNRPSGFYSKDDRNHRPQHEVQGFKRYIDEGKAIIWKDRNESEDSSNYTSSRGIEGTSEEEFDGDQREIFNRILYQDRPGLFIG